MGTYRGKKVIWIRFDYDPELVIQIKKHTHAKWTPTEKAWRLSDNKYHRKLCNLKIDLVGKEVLNRISSVNLPEFEKYQNMLVLKGYAQNTIRTYSIEFAQLLYVLKNYPVQKLTPQKLQSYFLYCAKELRLSENQSR